MGRARHSVRAAKAEGLPALPRFVPVVIEKWCQTRLPWLKRQEQTKTPMPRRKNLALVGDSSTGERLW
jgi:hypothetical protein